MVRTTVSPRNRSCAATTKLPDCAQWVLTVADKSRIVMVRTEWPFTVSFKSNNEVHVNKAIASATQMRKPPLDIEPALF